MWQIKRKKCRAQYLNSRLATMNTKTSYMSIAAANYLVDKALSENKTLTPIKLIKIVYIAHGWHLAAVGTPLLDEPVEAWKYGPVIPSIYHAFKKYKSSNITDYAYEYDEYFHERIKPMLGQSTHPDTLFVVDKAWEAYRKYSGLNLVKKTHENGTPWYTAWHVENGCNQNGKVISDTSIKEYYKKILEDTHVEDCNPDGAEK